MLMITLYAEQKKKTQIYRTVFWTLWEKARVGCFKRIASKHVYYPGWNRSPAQVGCMRQVLGPGALGKPRGSGWRGRWEGGLGWGTHVNPWLFHFNVWQNSLQIKNNNKKIKIQHIKIIDMQVKKKRWKQDVSCTHILTAGQKSQLEFLHVADLPDRYSQSGPTGIFICDRHTEYFVYLAICNHILCLLSSLTADLPFLMEINIVKCFKWNYASLKGLGWSPKPHNLRRWLIWK